MATLLLDDNFTRADNAAVGNAWDDPHAAGSIAGNRLKFLKALALSVAPNLVMRPAAEGRTSQVVVLDVPDNTAPIYALFRVGHDAATPPTFASYNYIWVNVNLTAGIIDFKQILGGSAFTAILNAAGLAVVPNGRPIAVQFALQEVGGGAVRLYADYRDATSTTTLGTPVAVAAVQYTPAAALRSVAGFPAVAGATAGATYLTRARIYDGSDVVVTVAGTAGAGSTATNLPIGAAPLAAPALTLVSARRVAVSFAGVPASGGVAPYTYQLHRGAASGFTPVGTAPGTGTCILTPAAGSIAAVADPTPPAGGLWEYLLRVVDSAAAPAAKDSARLKVWVPTAAAEQLVLCEGDSNVFNNTQATELSAGFTYPPYTLDYPRILAKELGRPQAGADCYAECVNAGHGGYHSYDLNPALGAGPKATIDADFAAYQARVAALGYTGRKVLAYRIGFNDCAVPATTAIAAFTANVRGLIDYALNDTSRGGPANTIVTFDRVVLLPIWYPTDGTTYVSGGATLPYITAAVSWPLIDGYNAALATIAAAYPGKVAAAPVPPVVAAVANNPADSTHEGLHQTLATMFRTAAHDARFLNQSAFGSIAAGGGTVPIGSRQLRRAR